MSVIHLIGKYETTVCGRHILQIGHDSAWTTIKEPVTCKQCLAAIKKAQKQEAAKR